MKKGLPFFLVFGIRQKQFNLPSRKLLKRKNDNCFLSYVCKKSKKNEAKAAVYNKKGSQRLVLIRTFNLSCRDRRPRLSAKA